MHDVTLLSLSSTTMGVLKPRLRNALCVGPVFFQEIRVRARGSWRNKERKTREAYPGLLQASGKKERWKSGASNIVHPSTVHQRETEADVFVITETMCSWNTLSAYVPPEAGTGSNCLDPNSEIWHPGPAHQSSILMATNSVIYF